LSCGSISGVGRRHKSFDDLQVSRLYELKS
jgi:hypothetical protein